MTNNWHDARLERQLTEILERVSVLEAEIEAKTAARADGPRHFPPTPPPDTLKTGDKFRYLKNPYSAYGVIIKDAEPWTSRVKGTGCIVNNTADSLTLATNGWAWAVHPDRPFLAGKATVLVSENVYNDWMLQQQQAFREKIAAFQGFLCGIAAAQVIHGVLRASKGHTPVFGTGLSRGEDWTSVEVAKAFGATQRLIERLDYTLRMNKTEFFTTVQAASAQAPIEAEKNVCPKIEMKAPKPTILPWPPVGRRW